jgi:hypothetical protein
MEAKNSKEDQQGLGRSSTFSNTTSTYSGPQYEMHKEVEQKSPKFSFFGMFKRTRTYSDNNPGFINRQMPAYWFGK